MKVIVASGGSGGHLFPAIEVAKKFSEGGCEVVFLGSFRVGTKLLEDAGYFYEDLNVRGMSGRGFFGLFDSLGKMIKALIVANRKLKISRPDVVIGFGGYGAFPVVLAAALRKIPTLIHEQNVVPGRANAVLARFVTKIAVSFQKSLNHFSKDKTVLTGCPVHAKRTSLKKEDILEEFHLDVGCKTLLVLGGSQGSITINEIFLKAVEILKKDLSFQVIHLCGQGKSLESKIVYERLNIPCAVFEFLDEIEKAYAVCDLVISRAGAATITEIAANQLPSILIPYPHAGGHQKHNADVLANADLAKVIDQDDLTEENLTVEIKEVLSKQLDRNDSKNVSNIYFPEAADAIAQQALSLARQEPFGEQKEMNNASKS